MMFFLMIRRPPRSTLFPYTTLFRSGPMRVFVDEVAVLRFDDGTPVTAASGIAPLGDGWLVAQDDATSAAWLRGDHVVPVRVLPPVDGHDRFSEAAGTKRLKPDQIGRAHV